MFIYLSKKVTPPITNTARADMLCKVFLCVIYLFYFFPVLLLVSVLHA